MSVHDLKQRLADVPGIESLTMALEGGRILVRWGAGYSAAADASASDYEIEVAVRNAIKLPPVATIPDKQPIPNAAPVASAPARTSGASTVSQLPNKPRLVSKPPNRCIAMQTRGSRQASPMSRCSVMQTKVLKLVTREKVRIRGRSRQSGRFGPSSGLAGTDHGFKRQGPLTVAHIHGKLRQD
jgi:hypothetical protein